MIAKSWMHGMALLGMVALLAGGVGGVAWAAERPADRVEALFGRDNLVAWCVVPFDSERRGPRERSEMLRDLGFTSMAYDWRAEDVPHFDEEMRMLAQYEIDLQGFWVHPGELNERSQMILDLLERHNIQTELWVLIPDPPGQTHEERVEVAVEQLRPLAQAAAEIGCSIGLYNHMGWFGEPENQLAIIEAMQTDNVGIVYNLHHGHHQMDRFAQLLEKMQPHLLCLNLNGMVDAADPGEHKILPVGYGERDLEILQTIIDSGYDGPIGILGHTMDDVEERLQDNLDGIDWLKQQLRGEDAGDRPQMRTHP